MHFAWNCDKFMEDLMFVSWTYFIVCLLLYAQVIAYQDFVLNESNDYL